MGLTLNVKNLRPLATKLGRSTRDLDRMLADVIDEATGTVEKAVREEATGKSVRVRSGRYRASIRSRVDRRIPQGEVGTKLAYARQIEYGGTIKAKKARFLTIPLPAAKTKAGVIRGGARAFKNTFFVKSRSGNLLLFGLPTGSGTRPEPLFVLKKSVKQKPKRVFENALIGVRRQVLDAAERQITRWVKRTL